jgi:hypothetical protein
MPQCGEGHVDDARDHLRPECIARIVVIVVDGSADDPGKFLRDTRRSTISFVWCTAKIAVCAP